MDFIKKHRGIKKELGAIAEVAGYLWQKNWAERNGGNISVNLSCCIEEEIYYLPAQIQKIKLEKKQPDIAGQFIYISGTGTRMRDLAKDPINNGVFIRVDATGSSYDLLAKRNLYPSSELPSHLSIHNFLISKKTKYHAVLHTHPTELIALTHNSNFQDATKLSNLLWSMIPETRVFVPKGIGVLPYLLPGSEALAKGSIRLLEKHDVILWEKHGALAIGENIRDCFDMIDTLSKSAQIYIYARQAGFEPQGLNSDQLEELGRIYDSKV
jgi:rhamnulose-1-phosphate aldolase